MKYIKNLSIIIIMILFSSFLVYAAHTITQNYLPAGTNHTNDNTPTFNFTVTGTNSTYNVTLIVNSSLNFTRYATNDTLSNITTTTLADGAYTIYVNATNGTVSNLSTTWNITIDSVAPNVTATSPSNLSSDTDGTVQFFYNVTDAYDITNCTLYIEGTANYTNYSITNFTSQNFTVGNMQESDHLEWFISCKDNASNIGNSSTYTIDTYAIPVANATPNIPSGGSSSTDDGEEYSVTLSEEEYTRDYDEGDSIVVEVDGEELEIRIDDISSESIDLYFVEADTTIEVNEGVKKKIDIDGDGDYDAYLYLEEIVDYNTATITIQLYSVSETTLVEETDSEVEENTSEVEESGVVVEEEGKSKWWIWLLVVGVIIIVAAVVFFSMQAKK